MKNMATELGIILIGYFTLVPAIQVRPQGFTSWQPTRVCVYEKGTRAGQNLCVEKGSQGAC